MILHAKITGLSVSKHCMSIKLSSDRTEQFYVESLKGIKGIQQKYIIEYNENGKSKKIYFNGKIQSINIRKGIFFVIHVEREKWTIVNIAMAVDEDVICKFFNRKEMILYDLLQNVSQLLNMSIEDVLYKFTTYEKEGRVYEGKRNIFELSDRHKDVVISKLSKIIRDKEQNKN